MITILPEGKFWRLVTTILILVSLVSAGVLFLLRSDWMSSQVAKVLQAQLEKTIGGKVSFGESQILFWPATWSVQSFSIDNPKGEGSLFQAAQVKATFKLLPLLQKRLEIDRITVVKPQVSLVRRPDGSFNFSGLFPSHPRTWDVRAGDLELRDGMFRFEDLKGQGQVTIQKVQGRLRPNSTGKTWQAHIQGIGGLHLSWRELRGMPIRSDFLLNSDGSIQVQRLNVRTVSGSDFQMVGRLWKGSQKPPSGSPLPTGVPPIRMDIQTVSQINLSEIVPFVTPKPRTATQGKGRVRVSAHVWGPLTDLTGDGSFSVSDSRWEKVRVDALSGEIRYARGELEVPKFDGKIFDGQVTGGGKVKLQGDPGYDFQMNAVGIRMERLSPFHGESRLQVSGDSRWDASVHLQGKAWALAKASGEGRLLGRLPDGQLEVLFKLEEGEQLSATYSGEVRNLQEWIQFAAIPVRGDLTLRGTISGLVRDPAIQGSVHLSHGGIRESAIDTMEAEFQYLHKSLEFSRLEIRNPPALYQAKGRILFSPPYSFSNPYIDAEAQVTQGAPQEFVSFFYKKLPLQMSASGRLRFRGDFHEFTGEGDLEVADGSAYGQTFDRGRVSVELNKDRIVFKQFRAEKGASVLEGQGWIGFHGDFETQLSGSSITLQDIQVVRQHLPMFSGNGFFRIQGYGSFHDPKISAEGEIVKLVLQDQDLGSVRFSMTDSRDGLKGEAALQGSSLRTSGEILWKPGYPFQTKTTFDNSPLTPYLTALGPASLKTLTASLSGRLEVTGQITAPRRIRMTLEAQSVQALYKDYGFHSAEPFQLVYEENTLRIDTAKWIGEGTTLTFVGGMIPFQSYSLFMTGEVDLRLLSLLTRNVDFRQGKAYLALTIRGPWLNPSVQGGVSIIGGSIRSVRLKQGIEDADMAFFFNGKQIVLESFQGKVGSGDLKASGRIDMTQYFPNLVVERFGLVLEIAHAVFRYPEGLSTRISGTLVFQGTPQAHRVRGEVGIEQGVYEKRVELRSMVLEMRKAREKFEEGGGVPFFGETQMDIHILGTNDIWVKNNLAKLPLQVDLILRGTPDHPQIFGNLVSQDGTFLFRRNEFKVLSATADFISTDAIRPVLDIHAQAEIRGYRIDLRLNGTVERFTLNLQSEPSLSETDILALLTVGQTAAEVAEAKTEIGATEATALLAGPLQEKVEEKVQNITGVDRFQVDPYYAGSKSSGGARLTVGKRLMEDRLYVTYTTALATEEDLIKMEYLLSRNVLLVGERDENGRLSGDLKFRLEFR